MPKAGGGGMRFPKSEAEVVALVRSIIAGITENPVFPSPPISSSDLRNLLDSFTAAKERQIASHAIAEQDTDAKDAAFEAMIAPAKAVLRYGEYVTEGDDSKLNMIGWGGRSPHTPIAAPGQPLNLHVAQQGAGTLRLVWERPNEGGAVAYFMIRRLGRGEGESWKTVETCIAPEITLTEQERGKELEYCVLASNRAGESLPSNSVMVVL